MDALSNFLGFIRQPSTQAGKRKVVRDFLWTLKSYEPITDWIIMFYKESGNSSLLNLLLSPSTVNSAYALSAIVGISKCLLLRIPEQQVTVDVILQFLQELGSERFDKDFIAVKDCRNAMIRMFYSTFRCYKPSQGRVCQVIMDEMSSRIMDILLEMREDHDYDRFSDKFHELAGNFIVLNKSLYDAGFREAQGGIDKLFELASKWLEQIMDLNQSICGSLLLLLAFLNMVALDCMDSFYGKLCRLYSERCEEFNTLVLEYSRRACSCEVPMKSVRPFYIRTFLTFKSRETIAMDVIGDTNPNDLLPFDPELPGPLRRDTILHDSFDYIMLADPEEIRDGISIEFHNENGVGEGVLREWISLTCKEMFSPNLQLFKSCPNDKSRFFPNHVGNDDVNRLKYFRFCGRMIGLAFKHRANTNINVKFASFFFKRLAHRSITWEDAKDADHEMYASCKILQEMDPEDLDNLDLTFEVEVIMNGSRKNIELLPGGAEKTVNRDNLVLYLNKLVETQLAGVVDEEIKSFEKGFADVLEETLTISHFLGPLELEDLDMMMFQKDPDISVLEWQLHTEYDGYTVSDEEIKWFWQVVESMTNERRRRLLFFSTSLVCLPPDGFSGLEHKFRICKLTGDVTWLPTASTCFYQLNLPSYPSIEIMRNKVYTITEEHLINGFGFS